MNVIMNQLEREHPDTNKDTVAFIRKETDRRLQAEDVVLPAILLGLVTVLLLIACANVAGLMIGKAAFRLREVATQLALGATRGALLRTFLTESAVLAFLGGALGVLLAYGSVKCIVALIPSTRALDGPVFQVDLRAMVYASLLCLAAVFLCGVAPAFAMLRDALRTGVNRQVWA